MKVTNCASEVRTAEFAAFERSEDAMPDLDPSAVESLLHAGARRRGVKVDAYRDLIQATADRARVGFSRTLEIIADFEKMPPNERLALVEQLALLKEQAAREGMSVGRFVTIMVSDDD